MTKINIPKGIFSKKTGDYTFTIMFFLIFSMFIFFAIRPSLTTAASLKKEEIDLQAIDVSYEKTILSIAQVQQAMEENRSKIPLLNQAIAIYPKVNKMIDDIVTVAGENSFNIEKAGVSDVNLFDTNKNNIQQFQVIVEGTTDFANLMKFTQALFNQRRLKTIPKMVISHDVEGTSSALLKVILSVEGYYL